jgi:hypothetical protein
MAIRCCQRSAQQCWRQIADRDQRRGAEHLTPAFRGKDIDGGKRERTSTPEDAALDDQPLPDRRLQ